ncbi:cyclopropane-fatty-acyl-phospholipid synthase [Xenophilus arseniciresistens]|uniref:Cyclopropane-fatty-acyl-phospholipid synthase n=1 Tax=Xenophilus arseniciresistens TaxID=1283306 RepID=A0AAE3SYJ6_9BURK|nr:cyclopropane-fatty-acyl-phospholipid synthase family protein [Xenophilus arseniciresistens]MDA7414891.1 cyclopropane-fatty-acyl-phospholipid synthase [Xenophilus arseniciresistens]
MPGFLLNRPAQRLLERLLSRVQHGCVTVQLPDGRQLEARGPLPGPQAQLHIVRWRALWRLLREGDLGFARAYGLGDWHTPELVTLLDFALANESAFGSGLQGQRWARVLARVGHLLRANTRRGSRDNIAAHYDLGNHFYAQWLDRQMLYSSALYRNSRQSLEQAQEERLQRILQLMDTPHGGQVLEIGCGWGALAVRLARQRQARVTALTLSREQLAHARQRAVMAGVSPLVELRLQDYRDTEGQYDRIVSIEMVEAVGEAFWPAYFDTLKRCLRPGGKVVLQAITIDEAHFERYRQGADFIQRCIFPGGMLPTPTILRQQAERAGLVLRESQRFGASYALTLAEWRRRFLAAAPQISALGFDRDFRRLWEYYLCYCEAGFNAGRVDVGLYVLEHADFGDEGAPPAAAAA